MVFEKNESWVTHWWIENMFNNSKFPDNFKEEFYKQSSKERNDWAPVFELDKLKIEKYILDNSTEEMFTNFKLISIFLVLNIILKRKINNFTKDKWSKSFIIFKIRL